MFKCVNKYVWLDMGLTAPFSVWIFGMNQGGPIELEMGIMYTGSVCACFLLEPRQVNQNEIWDLVV